MNRILITGTGLFTPRESISNEELVSSFNTYVAHYNHIHAAAIKAGELIALKESNEAFIEKASGIKKRYVMDKAGILDPEVMQPLLPKRLDEELSIQAEMAVVAAREAIQQAECKADAIDMVIVACSNTQRGYPAIAIEVQHELAIEGFAFDMNVACSSATFAIQTAYSAIKSGTAQSVLVVNPEICTAHLNFRDRDSHFIFGDACTAILLQTESACQKREAFAIIDTKTKTQFSNNIRNNFGYLTKLDPVVVADPAQFFARENMFVQNGRKVFKEIVPMVSDFIAEHLQHNKIAVAQLKRLWLHQANANINRLVAEKLFGYVPNETLAPVILDQYANTSSPGCVIAFHYYQDDFMAGDRGILCSFGAGYSLGSILVEKIAL